MTLYMAKCSRWSLLSRPFVQWRGITAVKADVKEEYTCRLFRIVLSLLQTHLQWRHRWIETFISQVLLPAPPLQKCLCFATCLPPPSQIFALWPFGYLMSSYCGQSPHSAFSPPFLLPKQCLPALCLQFYHKSVSQETWRLSGLPLPSAFFSGNFKPKYFYPKFNRD